MMDSVRYSVVGIQWPVVGRGYGIRMNHRGLAINLLRMSRPVRWSMVGIRSIGRDERSGGGSEIKQRALLPATYIPSMATRLIDYEPVGMGCKAWNWNAILVNRSSGPLFSPDRRECLGLRQMRMLIVFCAFLILFGCGADQPIQQTTDQEITVEIPAEHRAGEPLTVTALADDIESGTHGRLTLLGSYGIWSFESQFNDGKLIFDIPAEETQQAGWITAIVQTNGQTEEMQFEITPGPTVGPVIPLVGPKSITADGESWSIITVIPFDQYANPVADGHEATFQVSHPGDLKANEIEVTTKNLIAWERITSQTQAGKTFVTAQIGGVTGPEAEIMETADWPVPFTLTNEPKVVAADGKQLTEIRTSRIFDRHGNVLPDGTHVQFIVEDADGNQRILPTQAVDGIAKLPLQAPNRPEPMTIIGTVFAVESEPLIINFKPSVTENSDK